MSSFVHGLAAAGVLIGVVSIMLSLISGEIALVPFLGSVRKSESRLYYWIFVLIQVVMTGGCFAFAVFGSAF